MDSKDSKAILFLFVFAATHFLCLNLTYWALNHWYWFAETKIDLQSWDLRSLAALSLFFFPSAFLVSAIGWRWLCYKIPNLKNPTPPNSDTPI